MPTLWRLPAGGFEARPSTDIKSAVREAVAIARLGSCPIAFDFGGKIIVVRQSSDPQKIAEAYLRAINSGRNVVGPYPEETNTTEPLNLDSLNSAVHQVSHLLKSRHPGLITWNKLFNEKLENLYRILAKYFDA